MPKSDDVIQLFTLLLKQSTVSLLSLDEGKNHHFRQKDALLEEVLHIIETISLLRFNLKSILFIHKYLNIVHE